jgi:hypothetical protein
MSDLTYTKDSMFTTFFAENESGVIAYNEAAKTLGGTFKIFNIHFDSVIYQLKNAGYTVSKAKKSTLSMNDIFAELDALHD